MNFYIKLRQVMRLFRLQSREKLAIGYVLLLYTALVFLFLDFVPFLDGGTYFQSLITAAKSRFNLFSISTAGHPNIIYFLYLVLFQYMDPGNTFLLHVSNVILGSAAIYSFAKILQFIFRNENTINLAIAAAFFAINPVFVVNTIELNLDFSLVCFYLMFLYLLLYQKKQILILLGGTAMIFTKEPGVILYLISIVLYLIIFHMRKEASLIYKIKLIAMKTHFIIPPLIFLAYIIYKTRLGEAGYWTNAEPIVNIIHSFLSIDLFDKHFLTVATYTFIMNFNWILTFLIASFFLVKIMSFVLNCKILPNQEKTNNSAMIFISLLFIIIFHIFSSFKTVSNPRYFLPLYPLLIIIFYYSLSWFRNKNLKTILLLGMLALFLTSNFRTIDPLSKLIFGTFKFGKHDMLITTSITQELPTYGRDQLVYNLEYTNIIYLLDSIFKDVFTNNHRITTEEYFLKYSSLRWYTLLNPLDKTSFRRTFKNKNIIRNYFIDVDSFGSYWLDGNTYSSFSELPILPKKLYWVSLPIIKDEEQSLFDFINYLKQKEKIFYSINRINYYERSGYILKLYQLELIPQHYSEKSKILLKS